MSENDFQKLVNHCHNMAEKLLIEQNGEFYPFGATINNDGELTPVANYSGEDFPLSDPMIDGLKKYFKSELADEKIRACAITFDCLVNRDSDSEKTDAIAIECYSSATQKRTTYYFPYKRLTADKLYFGDFWGITSE